MEQRWLSLTGICSVLQTSPKHIKWLTQHNYLEILPGTGSHHFTAARFLDPTPAYAERMRTTEMIYRRRNPILEEINIDSKAIFTTAEVAALLGWSLTYAQKYVVCHKVAHVKIGTGKRGGLRLFTAKTIRELLWRRHGRKTSQQKCPFLVQELLDWFLQHQAEADSLVPTDLEFEQDDLLHKKLKRILTLPDAQKQAAIRELWEKTATAKAAAALLTSSR